MTIPDRNVRRTEIFDGAVDATQKQIINFGEQLKRKYHLESLPETRYRYTR